MKWLTVVLISLLLVVAPACSMLTPQQKANVRATVESEYAAGNITKAQRDASIEALDNDTGVDWGTLGIVGVNLVLALLGAPAIVRLQRGPATQTVGLPESKVHADPVPVAVKPA